VPVASSTSSGPPTVTRSTSARISATRPRPSARWVGSHGPPSPWASSAPSRSTGRVAPGTTDVPERVPVVDLARRAAALEPDLSDAIERVVRSGRYLLGRELEQFEVELAAFTGRRHAVAVASGTDALRLALLAMGVEPGDEVVVPAFTAVPTAAAVCAAGAVPVFADVDPDTATLDPASAADAVTQR